MSIILASGSPRRRELMEMLRVPDLKIIPAKGEETAPQGAGPGELVMALASAKGHEVGTQCAPGDVIIAADTVVWVNGGVFGKPHSREQAFEMLSTLSGNTHEVYTGVSVMRDGREELEYEVSRVTFRELSADEIGRYIATGEPMDKAGAYGAQGLGALLVERIDGDFFNVMGLPLCRLAQMLKKQGVVIL